VSVYCACGGKSRVLESRLDEDGCMRRHRTCRVCEASWYTVEVRSEVSERSPSSYAYFARKVAGICPRCATTLAPDDDHVECVRCVELRKKRKTKPTEPNDGGAGDEPCTTMEMTGSVPMIS